MSPAGCSQGTSVGLGVDVRVGSGVFVRRFVAEGMGVVEGDLDGCPLGEAFAFAHAESKMHPIRMRTLSFLWTLPANFTACLQRDDGDRNDMGALQRRSDGMTSQPDAHGDGCIPPKCLRLNAGFPKLRKESPRLGAVASKILACRMRLMISKNCMHGGKSRIRTCWSVQVWKPGGYNPNHEILHLDIRLSDERG
jgi:hypothetical protein